MAGAARTVSVNSNTRADYMQSEQCSSDKTVFGRVDGEHACDGRVRLCTNCGEKTNKSLTTGFQGDNNVFRARQSTQVFVLAVGTHN